MAWIESHQELRNHPKTKKAARNLHIHWAQVIGHLHALWWWAIDNAPDGDLSGYDTEELLDAAGWDGDGDLLTVFCTCGKTGEAGFLERTPDGRLVIHDWWDYAGKLITKRQQNADRVKEYRARNAHVTHTERVGTPLNSTVQYSTVTVPQEGKSVEAPTPVVAAEPPAPPPPPKRQASVKPIDATLTNPAVQLYRELVKLTPAQVVREKIGLQVTDLDQWRKVITTWLGAGYKPGNVNGMLEWYASGVPSHRTNGSRPGTGLTSTQQAILEIAQEQGIEL
jgi:hypothetical protein